MLKKGQTVYYTSGPIIEKATFLRYEGELCVVSHPLSQGGLALRRSRVFESREAAARPTPPLDLSDFFCWRPA